MPELGAFGSARGVPGNGLSYRKPGAIVNIADLGLTGG